MPISVTCPNCSKVAQAPDNSAGQRGRCRNCGAMVTVPPEAPPAAETPAHDDTELLNCEKCRGNFPIRLLRQGRDGSVLCDACHQAQKDEWKTRVSRHYVGVAEPPRPDPLNPQEKANYRRLLLLNSIGLSLVGAGGLLSWLITGHWASDGILGLTGFGVWITAYFKLRPYRQRIRRAGVTADWRRSQDENYEREFLKQKPPRQQLVKAAVSPRNTLSAIGGDDYDLVPEPERPHVRDMPSLVDHAPLGPKARLPDKSADELYAAVPWYRRSGPLGIMTFLGIFIMLPVIPVCFIVRTGPVYERKLMAPGQLKTWGGANRFSAVVILLLWIVGTSFAIYNSIGSAVSTETPHSRSSPPVVVQAQTPWPYRADVAVVTAPDLSPAPVPPVRVARPAVRLSRPPLTDSQCQAWANELEQSTATGDMGFLTRSFDPEGLAERAVIGITLTEESMRQVKSVAEVSIKGVGDLSDPLVKKRPCKVLWTRQVSGERVAMVRCLLKEGNADYLKLTLALSNAGEVRVVDMLELSSGFQWGHMLRTVALPLVVSADADALRSLSPTDKDIINNAALLGAIYRKTDPTQLQEVPTLIAQLPPSLQADPYLSILNVKASAQLGDAAFNAAVERHQQQFPNDPSLSYATLQKSVHDKDYVKMLEALFALDQAVGCDPLLAGLKAVCLRGHRQPDEGKAKRPTSRLEGADIDPAPLDSGLHCAGGEELCRSLAPADGP